MAHLQYFHEKEKKVCKLRGVPKSFQLDFWLKNVWEGFDQHLDRFLPLHTTAGLKEAIGAWCLQLDCKQIQFLVRSCKYRVAELEVRKGLKDNLLP